MVLPDIADSIHIMVSKLVVSLDTSKMQNFTHQWKPKQSWHRQKLVSPIPPENNHVLLMHMLETLFHPISNNMNSNQNPMRISYKTFFLLIFFSSFIVVLFFHFFFSSPSSGQLNLPLCSYNRVNIT